MKPVSTLMIAAVLLAGMSSALAEQCEGLVELPDSRFTVHADGTVSDRATGLMWKQCSQGLSGLGCAVGEAQTASWKSAVRQGEDEVFAGYSDWRLPQKTELQSLVMRRCYGVDTDVVNFPNTPADRFWTATPAGYYPGSAWTVHFGHGEVGYGTKRDSAYVRLVRDGKGCNPAHPLSCGEQYRNIKPKTQIPWPHNRGPLSP